jgi:excisionase family DNA binding protein
MSDQKKSLSAYWRYPEAAAFLGISQGTLRRKVMEGTVPCFHPFGRKGRVLFDPEELDRFVKLSRKAGENTLTLLEMDDRVDAADEMIARGRQLVNAQEKALAALRKQYIAAKAETEARLLATGGSAAR